MIMIYTYIHIYVCIYILWAPLLKSRHSGSSFSNARSRASFTSTVCVSTSPKNLLFGLPLLLLPGSSVSSTFLLPTYPWSLFLTCPKPPRSRLSSLGHLVHFTLRPFSSRLTKSATFSFQRLPAHLLVFFIIPGLTHTLERLSFSPCRHPPVADRSSIHSFLQFSSTISISSSAPCSLADR